MLNGIKAIRAFLEPKSIAIIGVPRLTGNGSNVLENLLWYGYKGQIMAVNPKASDILGIPCYANVNEIPDVVDLAIIQTSSSIVPSVVEDCIKKGIKAIIVQTDGFAELDSKGKILQDKILNLARAGGTRILGPNTFGVINTFNNFATPFAQFEFKKSPISAVSQSGIFSTGHLYELPLGKVIDLGNASDIGFCEALEYFAQDRDTKVILMHVEEIKNAQYFGRVARKTSKIKPILFIQGGKSEQGGKLAMSHSGSVAGKSEIYESAFRQYGMFQSNDLDEMKNMATSLLYLPPMQGNGLAIMTFTMGGAVMLLDACHKYGFNLARLSSKTIQKIEAFLPRPGALSNPIDLMPFFQVDKKTANESFKEMLYNLLIDKTVHGVVFISASYSPNMHDLGSILMKGTQDFPQKPILCWVWGPGRENMGDITRFNFLSARSVVQALLTSKLKKNMVL